MKNKAGFLSLILILWFGAAPLAGAGEITPDGQKLAAVLDSTQVNQLWLAGGQVNWQTGQPTGKIYANNLAHTHCSAFAAAVAKKLGVYLLHPPEHSTYLLANAQQDWLCSQGTNQGWYQVDSPRQAQQLANAGQLVLVTTKNPDTARPGHVAIVRPSTKSDDQILAEGPQIIQAGMQNYISTNVKEGFKHHPGAFKKHELLYFAHTLSWPTITVPARATGI
jgi:hypothetical protein